MSRRIQVIGAHSADFVWRAGGAIAKTVELGGEAEVIALSYGERGESGELWKHEGQTIENVKKLRHAEAEAAGQTAPKALPCQALDHGSGYLLAFGAMIALMRRMREGGSWHVQVSLARTGRWIRDLGRVKNGLAHAAPANIDDLMEVTESGWGRLHAVRHSAELEETPARWDRPSVPLGTHPASWP